MSTIYTKKSRLKIFKYIYYFQRSLSEICYKPTKLLEYVRKFRQIFFIYCIAKFYYTNLFLEIISVESIVTINSKTLIIHNYVASFLHTTEFAYFFCNLKIYVKQFNIVFCFIY